MNMLNIHTCFYNTIYIHTTHSVRNILVYSAVKLMYIWMVKIRIIRNHYLKFIQYSLILNAVSVISIGSAHMTNKKDDEISYTHSKTVEYH